MSISLQRRTRVANVSNRACQHDRLTSAPSPYASKSGYHAYSKAQLFTASTGKKSQPDDQTESYLDVFPSPLGLPGDEIALDPNYPTQSMRSWLSLPERNPVTSRRNIVYVAAPPKIDTSVDFMKAWCSPNSSVKSSSKLRDHFSLDIDAIITYLKTFYYGLEIKLLPVALKFMAWEDAPRSKMGKKPQAGALSPTPIHCVGLSTEKELIGIRVRETPVQSSASSPDLFPYPYQLDLNDLTDAALALLPPDAYALLLTTEHDIYESVDDDFCCGRAWGASRVAIVSSARYNPVLDDVHGVEREHMWPASHCKSFSESMISGRVDKEAENLNFVPPAAKRRKHTQAPPTETVSEALERAVRAHSFPVRPFQSGLQSTFLLRVCRTASHELGHCFGLDHCMYRACVMQATASVAEDMRQPPYLCPVCEAKVAWAVLQWGPKNSEAGQSKGKGRGKRKFEEIDSEWQQKAHGWRRERHIATKEFCEGQGSGFAALAAWSDAILELLPVAGAQPIGEGLSR